MAINKVLRKLWKLPNRSHVAIVLTIAKVKYLHDIIYRRFLKFCNSSLKSNSYFVSRVFQDSRFLAYTFFGYNFMYGTTHLHNEPCSDFIFNVSKIICSVRSVFGLYSPFEDIINNLSC